MEGFIDYILLLLTQFAGGPGPKENNLVRFGLPAILWAILLVVALSRQRSQKVPRESLLVWGFGLALTRELFMLTHVSLQLIGIGGQLFSLHFAEPLEHALTMAAVVMVAGAFLRYILDDERIARHYLQVGLSVAIISFFVSWSWWFQYATADPASRFNRTLTGLIFHLLIAVFAAVAIALLLKKKGWLQNVISLALGFYVVSGLLRLWKYVTLHQYSNIFCPICNSLYILSIPLLGYVYLREQSIEKRRAEAALEAYRDQLEELVEDRTTELKKANVLLQQEVAERKQAEVAIAQRNSELAAQNTIAATLSRSLDLDIVLDAALDMVLSVLEMEAGCVFLLESDDETLTLRTYRGPHSPDQMLDFVAQPCSCAGISRQAMADLHPLTLCVDDFDAECRSTYVADWGFQTLVGIPLISKGRAVGALSLGAKRPNAVPQTSLDLLTGIGHQIGMAIENAHLYRETENWAKELTMLHQVSVFLGSTLDPDEIYQHIAEQAAKLVGCQVAGIFHWDDERQEAIGVSGYGHNDNWIEGQWLTPDEAPILSELVSQRYSVAIEDSQTDRRLPRKWRNGLSIRSLLCVPVWSTERPLAFLFLIDQKRQRKWRRTEIELVESFVNRAAAALENAHLHKQLEWAAALEERQRIAAEMHDGLAQTLSYIALRTYNATQHLEDGQIPEALAEHHVIEKAIDQATAEVRRSISSLQDSPPPRRPLQDWVADVVDEHVRQSEPPVQVDIQVPDSLFVPPDCVEQIVRVLREALLNVTRHAKAEQAIVRLEKQGDEIVLSIEDNGQGFEPDAQPVDGRDHFGLSIMRARAARIGGRIQVDSAPGQGTRLVLTFLLNGHTSSNNRSYYPAPHQVLTPVGERMTEKQA